MTPQQWVESKGFDSAPGFFAGVVTLIVIWLGGFIYTGKIGALLVGWVVGLFMAVPVYSVVALLADWLSKKK